MFIVAIYWVKASAIMIQSSAIRLSGRPERLIEGIGRVADCLECEVGSVIGAVGVNEHGEFARNLLDLSISDYRRCGV